MKVKTQTRTHYTWNENDIKRLMAKELEEKHGFECLPCEIQKVTWPAKTSGEGSCWAYTITERRMPDLVDY